jgi:hypothetical protein
VCFAIWYSTGHTRCFSNCNALPDRILSAHGVRENAARPLFGLIKGEQCFMLTNSHPLRGAGCSIAILDDVASNSGWLHSDAEAGGGDHFAAIGMA